MGSRSRYRSRSTERRHYSSRHGSHSRYRGSDQPDDRRYSREDDSRERYNYKRDYYEDRRNRDDRYAADDRRDRSYRSYRDRGADLDYRDKTERAYRSAHRDDREAYDRRYGRDTSQGRHFREGSPSSHSYKNRKEDNYHDRKHKGRDYTTERRRSASNESACSFGSRVSFGGERKEEQPVEELDEETLLMKSMGFGEFATTKNKEHLDSDAYGVAKRSKRQYRQYMNRRGGFNRPLSPTF